MAQDPPRTHRRFTLSEKIAIVRESMTPGVSASFVARRHRIALLKERLGKVTDDDASS